MRSLIALFVIVSSQPAIADCICLNRGEEVGEGQTACIKTNSGNRLALCEKNLNVTNWKFLEEGCPVAELRSGEENMFKSLQLQYIAKYKKINNLGRSIVLYLYL